MGEASDGLPLPGALTQAAAAYDRLASVYDRAFGRRLDRAEDAVLAELLGDLSDLDVLDVGCGTGHLLDIAEHRPGSYLGIDASPHMLDEAIRKRGPADPTRFRFALAAAEYGADYLGPFDLAVSLWAFPYFDHPDLALQRMASSLRVGGSLVVLAYTRRYAARASHLTGDEPLRMRYDTRASLSRSFGRAGVRLDAIHPFRGLGDRWVEWMPQTAIQRVIRWELDHYRREPLCWIARGTRAA